MAYTYLWCIIIYAFLGWCGEVVYAAAIEKRFVNRGFLNGPVCPICWKKSSGKNGGTTPTSPTT